MILVPPKLHSNYMGTTVYHGPNVIGLWWPALISGLVAIGVDGTPRFIAAGVRTAYHTAFRTCSANGY